MRFGWLGLAIALLTSAWAGCEAFRAPDAAEAALIELMAQRLDVGRDVAWTKFNTGAAIVDELREKAVVAAMVSEATRAGVDPQRAAQFFNAQILASRQIQTELINGWRQGAPRPGSAPVDLVTVIRPRLDAIGAKMVAALAASSGPTPIRAARFQAALQARGFSADVARLAAAGLVSGKQD